MRRLPELSRLTADLIARQKALGISAESFARARNSGERRTPEKRELLRVIEERARKADRDPIPGRF